MSDNWGAQRWPVASIGAAGPCIFVLRVPVAVLRGEPAGHGRRGACPGRRPWNRRPRTP